MNVDIDVLGRMAIRLGRAYNHSWAKEIPKSVPWSWDMCKYYVGLSSARRPFIDDARDTITYDHSNSHWLFSPERVEVTMKNRHESEFVGFVRLYTDALGRPVLHVRLENWAKLSDGQLWRVDRAVTSLSCGPWAKLYSLPPVAVLGKALAKHLPDFPVNLLYTLSGDEPVIEVAGLHIGAEQREKFEAFDTAFKKFADVDGFRRWERIQVKEAAGE